MGVVRGDTRSLDCSSKNQTKLEAGFVDIDAELRRLQAPTLRGPLT